MPIRVVVASQVKTVMKQSILGTPPPGVGNFSVITESDVCAIFDISSQEVNSLIVRDELPPFSYVVNGKRAWNRTVFDQHAMSRNETSKKKPVSASLESKAVAVLIEHPDWNNENIAESIGCHVKSLSRFIIFKGCRALLKNQGKASICKGFKDKKGNLDTWE